ncbi:MAG: tetratricopeptide repeat protein [Chitinophagaceae bacterium]|nr:tetratricopeptide repeat protein [Chitinophagaceae bacterium]
MAHRIFFIVVALFSFSGSFSQDSLLVKDAQEIRYLSESLVKRELQDLLNNIALNGFELQETEQLIQSSYKGSRRIFDSEKARIESDLHPLVKDTISIDLVKYLTDFNLLYTKSDNLSVAFSSVKASHVKQHNYMYVKVYFSSFFNNKYKGTPPTDAAYTVSNRVAEVKIDKEDGKWRPFIVRVSFFNPGDTLGDMLHNIAVKNEGLSITADSATAASIDAEIEARKRKQMIEEENQRNQQFQKFIDDGDLALSQNNFTGALTLYTKAQEVKPYDPLPRSKISNARTKQYQATITRDQLFGQYLDEARLATRKREYNEAIQKYQSALDQKPDEKSKLQSEIDALTKKNNFLTEMALNYKAGNYKEAVKQYSAAIKKSKDSDFYLGRARSYVKLNESSDAIKDFSTAYDLDNENLAALEERADLYRSLGDAVTGSKKIGDKKDYYIKSLRDYIAYLNLNKKNIRIYEACSELQILLYNNIDDAIKALDDGLNADSKAKSLYYRKGLLLMDKKDFRKADINFTSALKIDSAFALAYYHRGVCQLDFNNVESAAENFNSARHHHLPEEYIGKIKTFAESFSQRSLSDFGAGKADIAIEAINDAIAIDPYNSNYYYYKGNYLNAIKQYPAAIENYDKAIELKPEFTDAFYSRGLSYYNHKNYNKSVESLSKALLPGYAQLYLVQKAIADSYLAAKDYANASKNYEVSIKTAGSVKPAVSNEIMAEIFNGNSKAYYAQNILDKAIDAGKNAIKRNDGFAEAYFNRGLAYHKAQKRSDAIADYTKAISLDNKMIDWYYQLAECQYENKEYDNAANTYSMILKNDSSRNARAVFYHRGLAYYNAGNFGSALPDYLQLINLGIDSGFVNFNQELGNIYLQTAQYDSAAIYYQKALDVRADNSWAMYGLGAVEFLQGKKGEALSWIEKSFRTKSISSADIKKDKLAGDLKNTKEFKSLVKKYL